MPTTSLRCLPLVLFLLAVPLAAQPQLNEIRTDQPGTDNDEYFELSGTPSSSLDGFTYLVIGDGTGGTTGVIEEVTSLAGESIPAGGYFVAAEASFTLGTADLTTSLNFENGDNVTHLLVSGFTGTDGQDLDTDDDGTLDATPWTQIEDCLALVGMGSEETYCATTLGPDGLNVTRHAFSCPSGWEIGEYAAGTDDTPGTANACTGVADVDLNEIRIDQGDPDDDEYFELAGAPSAALDGLFYLVIGDDAGGSSGVIEEVTDLAGSSIPAGGLFVAAEGTFSLGTADLTVDLNFEDADNVTHLVVSSFTGMDGDDLDTDDDGTLDLTPWSQIVDCVAVLAEAGAGDEVYCATTVGPDTTRGASAPGHVFLCPGDWEIGAFSPAGTDDTPGAANACGGTELEIFDIQGSGASSPVDGQVVTTSDNIVTAIAGDGFFIQTPDARDDADPDTSNGIFVFTGGAPAVSVGDQVDVTAEVDEFFDTTELTSSPIVSVDSSGNPLPAATVFDATRPSPDPEAPSCAIEFECYEGMLVTIAGGWVCSGNQQFGSDPIAEVFISAGERCFREPGVAFPGLGMPPIPTWDGNPEVFELDPDRLGLANDPLAGGSTFDATGVLGFEFEDWELWPTSLSITAATIPRAVPPRRDAAEFTVGSLNLFRLFADDDDYALHRGKLSAYIRTVLDSPDVLAVQEVENIGVLEDLALQIETDDPAVIYSAELIEGDDVGGIDVGYLVRDDTITVTQLTQLGADELLTFDGSRLHDRPPLLLEAEYSRVPPPESSNKGGASFPFAVLGNHTRSLLGIDDPTDGPRVRQKRLEQAQSIAQKAQDFQTANPTVPLIVIGDLNAFEFTDGYVDVVGQIAGDFDPAMNLLSGPDLVDPNLVIWARYVPQNERYSYIFEGNAQVLDHALTSTVAGDFVSRFVYGRGNADAARDLENQEGTALRSSDHDGLVLYLSTVPEIFADGFESGNTTSWSNSTP